MKRGGVQLAGGGKRRLLGAAVGLLAVGAAIVIPLARHHDSPPPGRPRGDDALPPWFGEPDSPLVPIHGVVHASTLPMTVRLAIDAPDPGIWRGVEVKTTFDGRFDFGPQRAGRYLVQAFSTTAASRIVQVDTTAAVNSVDVFAFPCREIAGRAFVPDKVGGIISSNDPGVPVRAASIELAGRQVATTDVQGRFRFCGPKDEFTLLMQASGYEVDMTRVFAGSRDGTARDEVFFALKSVSLEGIATVDGHPAVGLGIQPIRHTNIDHGAFADMPMAATTDQNGKFRFDGLAVATYSFRVLSRSLRQDLPGEFDLEEHQNRVELNIPAALSEKHLFDDIGARPQNDPSAAWVRGRVTRNGKPVPDALISGHVASDAMMWRDDSTRSTADGTFALFVASVELDRARPLFVSATHPGLGLYGSGEIEIAPGKQVDGLVIEVGAGLVASGTVTDASGTPMPGVIVALDEWQAQGLAAQKKLTDTTGAFTLRIEERGRHRLRAYDGDGENELLTIAGTSPLSVDVNDLDGRADGLRLVVARGRPMIRGVVVDESGTPLKASVRVVLLGGAKPVDTSANGEFELVPLLDEPYVVAAETGDGRVAYQQGVYLPAPPLRLVVREQGRLTIRCKEFQPMASIFVSNGDIGFGANCDQELAGLPPGQFTLFARQDHAQEAATTVFIEAGRSSEATLRLTARSEIRARAIEVPGNTPVEGADCEAVIPNGLTGVLGAEESARSAADGTFTLTLTNTRMRLRCEDPRFVRASIEVDVGTTSGTVDVRMVRLKTDATDVGANIHPHADGALVAGVADEAAAAGLRPGDVVVEADGVALAGMNVPSMRQLAFQLQKGESIEWKVKRDTEVVSLRASAAK